MPEIQIRLARPGDAAAIAKVLRESFAEFESLYTREGFAATTPSAEQVMDRMQEGPLWVAVRANTVLGTVGAAIKSDTVYVRGMAVLPEARGANTGCRLLETVEHWTTGVGLTRLFLSTTPFLHAAIRFYEKAGFRRTPRGPRDLFGTPLFTMEKHIAWKPVNLSTPSDC